jgi:hypothetical protein
VELGQDVGAGLAQDVGIVEADGEQRERRVEGERDGDEQKPGDGDGAHGRLRRPMPRRAGRRSRRRPARRARVAAPLAGADDRPGEQAAGRCRQRVVERADGLDGEQAADAAAG